MINVIYNYYSNGLLTPFEIRLFIRNKRFRDYVISLCSKEKQKEYKDDFKNFKRQESLNRSARVFQPIERKIDLMLSSEVLKYMTCQEENVIDLLKLFDEGYYILVNAKEGILRSEHVRYIATYILTLVRHAVVFKGTGYKKDAFLFYDEFQKFCSSQVTGDFAEIRKYGLHPYVSHQHHSQLYSFQERNHILNSLLNNFDEKLCGRLSNPEDARKMRDARKEQKLSAKKMKKVHQKRKRNFPPSRSGKYIKKQASEFADMITIQWLRFNHKKFLKNFKNEIEKLNFEIFLSVRTFAYTIFYKYYLQDREPNKLSDFGDLFHIFYIPYCKLAIIERDLCNVLNQIKRNSNILNNVKIRNIDFFKKWK